MNSVKLKWGVCEFPVSQIQSLRSRQAFIVARHSGIFCQTRFFTLQAVKFSEPGIEGTSYIGLTVSKKVGNAVKRNRVKRRLRVASRQIISSIGISGQAYIFIAKLSAINASWDDLTKQVIDAVDFVNRKIRQAHVLS
ncbi:MAG: ribonuclease P protein component [Holosporales bacterium]|nr:ribonuclease P protein component [Holosporales bacterium]